MLMATSRISNTIKAPDGTAIAGVPVTVTLMPSGGFRTADFTEVARIASTTTNASGVWQLDLERNAGITPANSWYEVVEQVPAAQGGKRVWQIAVGASDQSLLASLVTPAEQQPTVVPAGTVYLDQASADARYQALGGLSNSAPATIDPDDASSAGVSTSASRADHQHQFTTSAPSNIGLAGTNSEGSGATFVRNDHVHAYTPPACRVYHNATQSLTSAVETTLAFNSERFDTDTMHDTATNNERITFKTAGVYVVTVNIAFASNATGNRVTAIRLNGATYLGYDLRSAVNGDNTNVSLTTVYKFAANDYVEVRAVQNSGGALNINAAGNSSPEFSAVWVGVG